MSSALLLEAALRSVLLALAVWAGLRVFGVRNVLAQKAAWGLVLVSALGMPLLLPYAAAHWSVLPANVRVVIPDDPQTLLEELQARIKSSPQPKPIAEAAPILGSGKAAEQSEEPLITDTSENHATSSAEPDPRISDTTAYEISQPAPQSEIATVMATATQPPAPRINGKSILTGLFCLYLAIAGVLVIRLLCGLAAALRLLYTARQITPDVEIPHSSALRLRSSARVASPVTICSSIVLPADYQTWEAEKLRIVVAHERSHIRQGDFYLQLLAGLYAAAFWFSPLGWWLKHKLSDLAEAISDRAGLEEAADRASYAQILLEFAAKPRPTLIGVAMARSGSLSRRIERLLNDVSFRQAFAGTRRGLAAVIVVPIALFAATAFVRVEAAGQQTHDKDQVMLPKTGIITPDIATPPQEPAEASPKPEPIAPPVPDLAPQTPDHVATPAPAQDCAPAHVSALPAPAHVPAPVVVTPPAHAPASPRIIVLPGMPAHAVTLTAPRAVDAPRIIAIPQLAPAPPHASLALVAPRTFLFNGRHYVLAQNEHSNTVTYTSNNDGKKSSLRYYFSDNGDSYAIVRGDGSHQMSFNGDIHSSDIDKARQQAGGKDFLWFRHEGKDYIVDDPSTLAQIEAMYKPMEDLGRQQEELGKKQEALGKQQEALGHQQEQANVPTPDMSKEIAAIEESMAKLKASQGKNMTQEQFADLQEKLGELQGRLGDIQGEIGSRQGEVGERMGALGEKMGALGEQMGELGERQGKIAKDADQKVKSIIDQSLHNGKARPIQ